MTVTAPRTLTDWQVTARDRDLWDRELASFVPPRIFDSHVHLYDVSHFHGQSPALCAKGPPVADWKAFQQQIGALMPNRSTQATCFGFPASSVDFDAANDLVARECQSADCRGQMLVQPSMEAEFIRQAVRASKFVGLKPYHVYADSRPTFDAEIPAFLPESQVQVAHELGLTITLHIVRSRALADTANQEALRRYATRYPNARLILAHAARGFNPHHTIEGIQSLRGLGNIWFDSSVVTDAGAIEAIARVMGHERLLYGSDFPVSHLRGRCVALGDSFLWLTPENTKLDAVYGDVQFALVGHEALRTLKIASRSLNLTDSQVEDIFLNNAARLWEPS